MRRNPLWLLLAVALGVSLGYWWNRRGPHAASATVLAAPVRAPAPEVPIQDRKTIDFSSGHPVVKDSAQEQALIDASARDMAEATKNIRFEPTAPAAGIKPPDPAPAPPKP
jgi:hypothetical protein